MYYFYKLFPLVFILLFAVPVTGTPHLLNHQGRIVDSSNNPLSGSANLTFELFVAPSGGSAIWSQTLDVTMDDGRYSVELGPGSPNLEPSMFEDSDLYLGVTLEDQDEFMPRQKVVAVPYALFAGGVSGEVNAIGGLLVDGEEVLDSDGNMTVPGDLTVPGTLTLDGPMNHPQLELSELPTASSNNRGQLYYITDEEAFYFSNGSQWMNLSVGGGGNGEVLAPIISSISPNQIEPGTDETITIRGQNFEDGCEVEIGGELAPSFEFVNAGEVNATTGELEIGVYSVRLSNPVGLRDTVADGLIVDPAPVWITEEGMLGFVVDAVSGDHFTLEATDAEGQTVTYALISGSLPPGLSLDTNTGVISGDPDDVDENTDHDFVITATDTAPVPNVVERSFTIRITDMIGHAQEAPGLGCKNIVDLGSSTGSGTYWINPDESGDAFEVFCEMDENGGGWIKARMTDDHQVLTFQEAGSNGIYKCSGDQNQYYSHLSGENNSYIDITNGSSEWSVDIVWFNYGTDSNFSTEQIAEISANISEISETTRMVAVNCDCDWGDLDHNFVIFAADDTSFEITPGDCWATDERAAYYIYHHTSNLTEQSGTHRATNGENIQVPDPKFFIPTRLVADSGQSGGGGIFGYEKEYVLVR